MHKVTQKFVKSSFYCFSIDFLAWPALRKTAVGRQRPAQPRQPRPSVGQFSLTRKPGQTRLDERLQAPVRAWSIPGWGCAPKSNPEESLCPQPSRTEFRNGRIPIFGRDGARRCLDAATRRPYLQLTNPLSRPSATLSPLCGERAGRGDHLAKK